MISKNTLQFLADLKKNNNREWFAVNKDRYETARAEFEGIVAEAIARLSKSDPAFATVTPKECMLRIYRDVRFSKDKTPYNPFFRATLTHTGRKCIEAGYYIHIEPGNKSVIGGGLHNLDSKTLALVRNNIIKSGAHFENIIEALPFKKRFGDLWDDRLKTVSRGFSESDEYASLLKYKSFVAVQTIADTHVASATFIDQMLEGYRELTPFISWLNNAKKG